MIDTGFRADLHLHTDASDGTMGPREVIRYAAELRMNVVAIADHDTTAGLVEASAAGEAWDVTVLPAMELSAGGDEEIHLLGYGVDPKDDALQAYLRAFLEERRERMRAMLDRLSELGMPIVASEVEAKDSLFMGRGNLARVMMRKGFVGSMREAFSQYLNPGKPAYVPRRRIGVQDGIAALRSFGVVPVLAHPGRLKMDFGVLTARLPGWIDAGLCGIEAYHPSHTPSACQQYDRLARSNGLLVTGGSDFHRRDPDAAQIGAHLPGWKTVEHDIQTLRWRMNEYGRRFLQ